MSKRKRAYIPRWKKPRHRIKSSVEYMRNLERALIAGRKRATT